MVSFHDKNLCQLLDMIFSFAIRTSSRTFIIWVMEPFLISVAFFFVTNVDLPGQVVTIGFRSRRVSIMSFFCPFGCFVHFPHGHGALCAISIRFPTKKNLTLRAHEIFGQCSAVIVSDFCLEKRIHLFTLGCSDGLLAYYLI